MLGFHLVHKFDRVLCKWIWVWVKNGIILPTIVIAPGVCGPPHHPPGRDIPPAPPGEHVNVPPGPPGIPPNLFIPPSPWGYPPIPSEGNGGGGYYVPPTGPVVFAGNGIGPHTSPILPVNTPPFNGFDECPPEVIPPITIPPDNKPKPAPEPHPLPIALLGIGFLLLAKRK